MDKRVLTASVFEFLWIFLVQTETRSVSVVFRFVSWNQQQKSYVCFVLFRGFKPLSKQPKQTDLFWNKAKQTKTTLNFLKITKKGALLNCYSWPSVCFGSIKTSKLSVLVKKWNNRNKLFQNKLFQNKPKQTKTKWENSKFSEKNTKICSLANCFGWSLVCFDSIETSKLSFLV